MKKCPCKNCQNPPYEIVYLHDLEFHVRRGPVIVPVCELLKIFDCSRNELMGALSRASLFVVRDGRTDEKFLMETVCHN